MYGFGDALNKDSKLIVFNGSCWAAASPPSLLPGRAYPYLGGILPGAIGFANRCATVTDTTLVTLDRPFLREERSLVLP
jgi:hypothetical protein